MADSTRHFTDRRYKGHGAVVGDEPPTDQVWCPTCEVMVSETDDYEAVFLESRLEVPGPIVVRIDADMVASVDDLERGLPELEWNARKKQMHAYTYRLAMMEVFAEGFDDERAVEDEAIQLASRRLYDEARDATRQWRIADRIVRAIRKGMNDAE